MGIIDALATRVTSGVSQKSQAGNNRGIPPFKKRRVGHPAIDSITFETSALPTTKLHPSAEP